jgi:hypothetical protein
MSGRLAAVLAFVLQCLYALCLGFILGMSFYAAPERLLPLAFLYIIVYFLVINWLATLVHEAGHALAFLLLDFRLLGVKIGPLFFKHAAMFWYWEWKGATLTNGFTLAAPRQLLRFGRRFVLAVMSGPLAGLLFGSLLLEIYHLWDTAGSMAQVFLLGAAGMSLLTAVISLIPLPVANSGGLAAHTDAELVVRLGRGDAEARWLRAYYAVLGASAGGQRPSQWLQSWLENLTAPGLSAPSTANGAWLLAHVLLDRGEIEAAAQALNRSIANINAQEAPATASLSALAAYFETRYGAGPKAARDWLQAARLTALDERSSLLRSQAAVWLAEGNPEQALVDIQAALEELGRSIEPGSALLEIKMLEELQQEALRQQELLSSGAAPAPFQAPGIVQIEPLVRRKAPFWKKGLALSQRLAIWLCMLAGMVGVALLLQQPNCSVRLWENFFCP